MKAESLIHEKGIPNHYEFYAGNFKPSEEEHSEGVYLFRHIVEPHKVFQTFNKILYANANGILVDI